MKQLGQIETVFTDSLTQMKNPLPILRRGLYDIGDDVSMPLIRPTRQAQNLFGSARGRSDELIGRWGGKTTPHRIARRRRCISLLPCSRFCQACSMRQAITRSARLVSPCAGMAVRFVTIR